MQLFSDLAALHRIPEQDRHLPKTLAYLQKRLGSRAFFPMEGAIALFFDFGKAKSIAFRSDMDALPTGHNCGHDGHMAMLLGLADRLREGLTPRHNILLIFQPAEETTGGAWDLCRTGIFAEFSVGAVFGMHIFSGLPAGKIFSRPGCLMAGSCQVDVAIEGKAGHLALEGPNAVAAGASFYARTAGRWPEGIVDFGLFRAGVAGNVRAPEASLRGSIRYLQEGFLESRREILHRAAQACQAETGCSFRLALSPGYPPVVNPGWLLERLQGWQETDQSCWLSEDFSRYQQHLPGAFFFLGAGNGPALHSENFTFPRQILSAGLAFWEAVARDFSLDAP